MEKTELTVSMEPERLDALRYFLAAKNKRTPQKELQRALEELPAGSRALLYRKYYYRQSTAQIAAELGLTERAVEGKLYRLKKRLRKSLGGEGHAGT